MKKLAIIFIFAAIFTSFAYISTVSCYDFGGGIGINITVDDSIDNSANSTINNTDTNQNNTQIMNDTSDDNPTLTVISETQTSSSSNNQQNPNPRDNSGTYFSNYQFSDQGDADSNSTNSEYKQETISDISLNTINSNNQEFSLIKSGSGFVIIMLTINFILLVGMIFLLRIYSRKKLERNKRRRKE